MLSSCTVTRTGSVMTALWMCVLVIATLNAKGGDCLSNVKLAVIPPAVQLGQSVRLACDYDLDGGRLYTIKFYRGRYEFYRYTQTPKGPPSTKVFALPFATVDLSHSNSTQVVLTNVGFPMSGNLTCEVTTENPGMTMAQAGATMTVVALPRSPPRLWTQYERYEIGDTLLANCTAPPSTPPSQLTFQINNRTVPSLASTFYTAANQEQWSTLSIHVALEPRHFRAGRLALQCVASLPAGFAVKSETRELGVKPAEPVPERVTSASTLLVQSHALLLVVLAVLAMAR
ncbi:uncharacterized protein LOC117651094 [Thrips palmi]|uniref:Uncharacterized protein LOC117651094 n=1 Tax=Thrips palmi TaxID=161013 RepID=A0A6P8ZZZ3_THRPL|nr:uncharacterized protein LOC117651094 [Thrips palmi]